MKKEELKEVYYESHKWVIKGDFTEEEYEKYLDFGMELGLITIEMIMDKCPYRSIEMFKSRMNFIDRDYHTLAYIGNKYGLTRERIRQIIEKVMDVLRIEENRNKYVTLFNKVASKDIGNYLIVGVMYMYSISFLKCFLTILDEKEKDKIINNIMRLLRKLRDEEYDNWYQENIGSKIYKLINFPSHLNPNASSIFDSLEKQRETFEVNNTGVRYLEQFDVMVDYESNMEKRIIGRLSRINYVKNIKTQSLVIKYVYNGEDYKYYPDLQVLTTDNKLIIIEVKPLYNMIEKNVMIKYKALKLFCEKNGFGYVMIDERSNTFEDIQKTYVPEEIEKTFIDYIYEKKSINYQEYRAFRREYNLKLKHIAKIVLDSKGKLEFNSVPFYIRYAE